MTFETLALALMASVTTWSDYLFNIWPFTTMKIGLIANIIFRSMLKIVSITTNTFQKMTKSFKILPNLVTLDTAFKNV